MKSFFVLILSILVMLVSSCMDTKETDDYKLSVSGPSGAPSLALASMCKSQSDLYSFSLNKDAQALRAEFLANEVDVIVAPINLGATLYNNNQNYKLAASVTFGNLYLVSTDSAFDSVSDLIGKEVTFFGQGTINQHIVETVLSHNNVVVNTDDTLDFSKEVNITYVGSTQLTAQAFMANNTGIYLIAEPALSNLKSKVNNIKTISIQDEYKKATDNDYIQAACFINKNTIENHKSVVDTFINNLEDSINMALDNPAKVATYASELELGATKEVFEAAIPNCGLGFVKGIANKSLLDTLFTNALSYCGGKLPDEGFYYQA